MVLQSASARELQLLDKEEPIALPGDVLVKVRACGVCRTDLHIVDGVIDMSDVPSFPYEMLWGERVIRSVANLTRQDAMDFLALAPTIPVEMHVQQYWLGDANHALSDLREGRVSGAAVLMIES